MMQQINSMQSSNSPSDEKSSAQSLAAGYKVFVGGLSVNCKSRELRQYLEKFGEVTQCDVAGEKEGKSKGFAFATFRTKEARVSALGKTHNLKGKTFEVRELVDSSKNSELLQELSRRKLYLSNLKKSVSEAELTSFFSRYGCVEELTINRDVDTQESKGFGFVMFTDSASVRAILGTNQSKVLKFAGSDLIVKQAIPKKEIERQKQMLADDDYGCSEEPELDNGPGSLNEQFYNLCHSLGSNYFGQPGAYQEGHNYSPQHYHGSQHGTSPDYYNYDGSNAAGYHRIPNHPRHFDFPDYHQNSAAQAFRAPYGAQSRQAWPVAQVDPNSYLGLAATAERAVSQNYHSGASEISPPAQRSLSRADDCLEVVWEKHRAHPRFDDIQLHRPFAEPYPGGLTPGKPDVPSTQPHSLKSTSGKFDTDSVETTQHTEGLITPQLSGLGLGAVCTNLPDKRNFDCGDSPHQMESASTHLWLWCDQCRTKSTARSCTNSSPAQRSIFDFLRNQNCACRASFGRSEHISLIAMIGPHTSAAKTEEWRCFPTNPSSQLDYQERSQLQSAEEWPAFPIHQYSSQVRN